MHIEFPSQYEPALSMIVEHLKVEAHLFNSFNSSGETVVLSAERDQLEEIADAADSLLADETHKDVIKKIQGIIKGSLR